jgi:hypothetical protein
MKGEKGGAWTADVHQALHANSGARPEQGGHGHVAERPEAEWRQEFVSRGLAFEPDLTRLAREMCDEMNIIHRRNIQVFRA